MSDKNRILIVDDDEVVRRSYLRSLESISRNIEDASNGEEALQTMEQNPFDVVLLDLRMPGQDGLSVLRTIKQKWPESEVVISPAIRPWPAPRRPCGSELTTTSPSRWPRRT